MGFRVGTEDVHELIEHASVGPRPGLSTGECRVFSLVHEEVCA